MMPSEQNIIESTIDHLASRLTPVESVEEVLDRIEKYATNPHLPPRTAVLMVAAAVRHWRSEGGSRS